MILIAGILLTEGLKYVEEIRTALMGGAYLFAFAGFVEGTFLAGEDMKGQLFNLVKIAVIASLVVGFPSMIKQGDTTLAQIHSSIAQGEQDAFRAQIEAGGTEPSWSDIPSRISYSLGICLQKIGLLGYHIVYWAKDLSILLLISVSPLLLGFLAFSYTRSLGINFLITSLTVILWNIGFAVVDTLLVVLGNVVMPMMGAGAAGAAVVTAGPQFFVLCLVATVLPIALYCAVPIITAAIMRGTNIAGAAMGAYGMAHHGVSHTAGAATALASGVGSFADSLRGSNSLGKSITSLGSDGSHFGGSSYGTSRSTGGPFMSSEASSNMPQSSGTSSNQKGSSDVTGNPSTSLESVGNSITSNNAFKGAKASQIVSSASSKEVAQLTQDQLSQKIISATGSSGTSSTSSENSTNSAAPAADFNASKISPYME